MAWIASNINVTYHEQALTDYHHRVLRKPLSNAITIYHSMHSFYLPLKPSWDEHAHSVSISTWISPRRPVSLIFPEGRDRCVDAGRMFTHTRSLRRRVPSNQDRLYRKIQEYFAWTYEGLDRERHWNWATPKTCRVLSAEPYGKLWLEILAEQ